MPRAGVTRLGRGSHRDPNVLSPGATDTLGLVDHFFRHEYGKLVATLSRRVGVHELEAVEDAAQSALAAALERWPLAGQPEQPSAWLFRVAHNALIEDLRRRTQRRRILERTGRGAPAPEPEADSFLAGELRDDLLRMLFVCCDAALPDASQLALALKTVCGFDVREIAHRLLTSEANVYKRLARARARLREVPDLGDLEGAPLASRLPSVHGILYLLFTEGYLSSHAEVAIRRELCDEALRLGKLLAEHPVGRVPETAALLALMHLQAARLAARRSLAGGLLLLAEQDRTLWDAQQIRLGLEWLARSAEGDVLSRYHVEAGIAAEHCLAPSLAETRWDRVADSYRLLDRVAPSPLNTLNRAVAVAEWKGPAAGLAELEGFEPPAWPNGAHLWSAVLADLHRRCGDRGAALRYRRIALDAAPNEAIRRLLERRLGPADA